MEQQQNWQQPPLDFQPFTLMLFAQFGAILGIALWFLPDEISDLDLATAVLILGIAFIGAMQLFRVKNGRLLTYPAIALLALSWVVLGEFDIEDAIFVTIFMSVLFTFLVYLPALGFEEYGLSIRPSRKKWLLLVMTALLATFQYGPEALEIAMSGEAELWDEVTDEDEMVTLSAAEKIIVSLAAVLFVLGAAGLVLTGGFGISAGPVQPMHMALSLAIGHGLMLLFWMVFEAELSVDVALEIITIGGLLFLPSFGFFGTDGSAQRSDVAEGAEVSETSGL